MNKVREYKILVQRSASELTPLVNQYLQETWQLYGQPYAFGSNHFQAVVKYD